MVSPVLPCSCALLVMELALLLLGALVGAAFPRSEGCPDPPAPHQFPSPGLTVFFSSHVPLREGGESHEHPSSWALGRSHLAVVTSHHHRAQLNHGQRCIPDPGQTHLVLRALLAPMADMASSLRGFWVVTWGSGSAQ